MNRGRTKLEDLHFPILKLTTKLQDSKHYGTGMRTETQNNRMELRVQK